MTETVHRPQTATTTLVTRLRDRASSDPTRVALREKDLGVWQEVTWAVYWDIVQDVAHGLLALGVERGDRVAVHSENRREWLYTDLATVATGGITVGLYPTNPAAEVRHVLSDSGAKVLVAEDQEQVDKALEVAHDLSDLERIVYLEPRGIRRQYDDPRLMWWDELLALGREHRASHQHALEETMAAAEPDDVITLIYTSGTTGPPKGAMVTVANVEFAIATVVDGGGFVSPPPSKDDVLLSYLPLSHVVERTFTTWFNAAAGSQISFAESIDTVQANLREVQPTILFGVPRIWEKILAGVSLRAGNASRLKRASTRLWMGVAGRVADTLVRTGGVHTASSRVLLAVGHVFYFRALRDRMGMRKVRFAVSGAAPIAPEVLRFFMGIGVPMHEAYGMTENTAVATSNRPGRVRLGTVGEPHRGTELRLDDATGEVLVRHPAVFKGYWNNPEATAATVDSDGWLHTGDVGEWVDGTHLRITDRMKDIIITSGGKNIAPSEMENVLKASPYVKEALVVGDRRPYLVALIGIEIDTVGDWAQRRRLGYTTYSDLAERPEVVELVQGVVDEANSRFAHAAQVKHFRLLRKELDHEDGELTATQKLKRAALVERFGDMVEAMYSKGDSLVTELLQSVSRGIGSGSVYALLALGFVIIYRSTKVISFAQPALMVAGAVLVSYLVGTVDFLLAVPLAAIGIGLLGLVIERVALRPMIGKPVFVIAIITIGLDIVIRVVVSSFIGLDVRQVGDPWGLRTVDLAGVQVQQRHIAASLTTLVIVAALYAFFRYSRLGLAMRAASLDQEAAQAQGISVGSVFALSWAIAGGLAAVAGTFVATGGGIDQGTWIIALKALPAIILGGLDSVGGAVIGGLVIGVTESLFGTYQNDYLPWLGSNFALVSAYVVMLAVLLVRPYGLFGTREVERV